MIKLSDGKRLPRFRPFRANLPDPAAMTGPVYESLQSGEPAELGIENEKFLIDAGWCDPIGEDDHIDDYRISGVKYRRPSKTEKLNVEENNDG